MKMLETVKSFVMQHKRMFALCMAILCMGCMFALPASAESTTTVETVSWTDFSEVLSNLTAQVNVGNIVAILAALVGACIGLVFMWWGVRKLIRVIMGAFKKGKVSV